MSVNGEADVKKALGLFSIAGSLNSAVDLDFLLQKIGTAAEQLLDSEASAIMLVTDDKQHLFFKVASGEKGQSLKTMRLPLGQGIAGWVAQSGKPEVVEDTRKDPHFAADFDRKTGFVTRSALCVPMVFRDELIGVVEVLNRRSGSYTQEHVDLLTHMASFAAASISHTKTNAEQNNFLTHGLDLLCLAVETTRPNMEGHCMRSAKLARAIGRSLGVEDHDYRMLYYAGMLHDIGYIAMNSAEFLADMGVMKASEELHPTLSAKMLEGITMMEGAVPLILHHHERFDGAGFPDKLAGDAIPLGARILSLVEAVEDLRMVGLRGRDLHQKALQEAQDGAGKSFDPKVVKAFVDLLASRSTAW
ncbi:MAG: HD domain-containing phosphohydrolase [Elusimicrobiota bacterium]